MSEENQKEDAPEEDKEDEDHGVGDLAEDVEDDIHSSPDQEGVPSPELEAEKENRLEDDQCGLWSSRDRERSDWRTGRTGC